MMLFPFWALIPRGPQSPAGSAHEGAPMSALTFSTTSKMAAYFSKSEGGHWKIRLVSRPSVVTLVVADLHSLGHTSVRHDVEPDGSGGQTIPLRELLAEAFNADEVSITHCD
jgi:hypothetical protein